MICEVAVRLGFVDLVLQRLSSAKENLLVFLRSHKNAVMNQHQQSYPHILYPRSLPVPMLAPPSSNTQMVLPAVDQLLVPYMMTLAPTKQPIPPHLLSAYLKQCNNYDNNFHRRPVPRVLTTNHQLLLQQAYLNQVAVNHPPASSRVGPYHHHQHHLRRQSLSPPSTPSSVGSISPPPPASSPEEVIAPSRVGDCVSSESPSATSSLLKTTIRHEILKQLQSGSVITKTPSVSAEQKNEETPVRPGADYIMQAKGVKRQLDIGGSPHIKRSRGNGNSSRGRGSNQHNFRDEWQYPNMSSPPTPMQSDPYAKASNHIWHYFLQNQQSSMTYCKKMALRDALFSVMRGVFPHCGLYVVGSSMSGFGSESSDMDLCLMISHSVIDQKKEATEILRVLFKALRSFSFIKHPLFIKAKVPIIKFYDKKSGVECDLNVNNSVGIRNTHLLNAYSKLDWRVRPLVLFTKHWAKTQDINDASKATISSYSLVLMVIHYLQCGCSPPVLPSLHQEYPYKFSRNLDVRTLSLNEPLPNYTPQNHQSLGELFTGFLDYYANHFNFERDAISVRFGKKLPVKMIAQQDPDVPMSQWKYLNIEEPFDLSNTARSVYDGYIFQRVQHVIKCSHRKMAQTRDINTILCNPF